MVVTIGLAAVNASGGISVQVGFAWGTNASFFLPNVSAVHAWLSELARRMHA
ncbi:hypothetical protein HYV43_05175 [Candidatus Micrarchaeota archaeon]|nr:hypothetical protein [Candidatus Micrarchaeota archaeon]